MIVSVRNGCVEFVSDYEQKGAEKLGCNGVIEISFL